jgi:hypothetical protein
MLKTKMNLLDIEALVLQGESDTLEFKKSTAELVSAAGTFNATRAIPTSITGSNTQKNRGWEDGIARAVTLDDLDHNEIVKTICVATPIFPYR